MERIGVCRMRRIAAFIAVMLSGSCPAAFANAPTGIAVDKQGNVYCVDMPAGYVFKIARDGSVSRLEHQFRAPKGLTFDGDGNLYVTEYGTNGRVSKIDTTGSLSTVAHLDFPHSIAVDGRGNLYVTQDYVVQPQVVRITPSGQVQPIASFTSTSRPHGVAVDSKGNVYVALTSCEVVKVVEPGGAVVTIAGGGKEGGFADGAAFEARFATPWGLCADGQGNLYVADMGNCRIRKIASDGTVTTLAGSGKEGYADGKATEAKFLQPFGVAVDQQGIIYVLDDMVSGEAQPGGPPVRIRKVTPDGKVTTLYPRK